jgi:Nucleopolyhedrovirus P10 protein
MSSNILLIIRQDIAALSLKVDDLQASVDAVQNSLPDVTEINDKLDDQSAKLDALQATVTSIDEILNPTIPDIPDIPDLPVNRKQQQHQSKK